MLGRKGLTSALCAAFLLTGLLTGITGEAHATWSVIAVDKESKRVVITTATCVPQSNFTRSQIFKDLPDIQGVVVPGIGVAAAQAASDPTNANQAMIYRELTKGTDPAEIVQMLMADKSIQNRQFGIVDVQGRSAGFSGSSNAAAALAVQGQVAGTQIVYSIQGNTLRGPAVIQNAVRAFEAGKGSVTDRALAALEAGDEAGGDKRCSCETNPSPKGICTRRNALMAYILAADAMDTVGTTHDDGKFYRDGKQVLYLYANDENTKPEESVNPVETLRMRYDAWKKAQK